MTARLLNTFCENPNIMPHLHLSLQSGSDIILKKMCRQYTIDEFRQVVESVKARLDRPAITTDIIVGFPGETDTDFQKTIDISNEIGFAKMHIFSYSPRQGTAATKSNNIVDKKTIKKRSERLHKAGIELGQTFRRQFIGETARILIESDTDQIYGRSERYFKVYLEKQAGNPQNNDIVRVKLIENRNNEMIGKVL
jgi:threonylcarbamoyladenosine tRNA methylthiotransferase MtaB